MTSAHKPVFLVISQNQALTHLVKEILSSDNTTIKTALPSEIDNLKTNQIHYIIFLIQRSLKDQDTTSSLINLCDLAKAHQSKIAIVDIHKNQVKEEEVESALQLLKQVSGSQPLFRYILTKDLFQNKSNHALFTLEQEIRQVILNQKIEVSSKGENLNHPLNLEDLISATLKSLFLERLAGKKLTIIGDSLKDLELAYLIKDELEKTDKTLSLDTVKKDVTVSQSILNASAESRALLKWLPEDSSEDKLKVKISKLINQPPDHNFFAPKKQPNPVKVENTKPPKKISLHKIEKRFLASISLALVSISLFSLVVISAIYVFFLSLSLKKTKTSLDHLTKGDTVKVEQQIQTAIKYLQVGEDISHYILPAYQVFSSDLTLNINNFSSLLRHSQSTIQSINESYQLANNLYHDLFTPSGVSSAKDISIAVQSRLRSLHQELSQIEIIQKNHTFPSFFNQKLTDINFANKINTLINQTTQGLKLLESFSTLLASQKPQFIALLVQDNNQLKSSGGTIKAVVLANIENQKIINTRILSPNQIDQQMVGQITSPPVIEALTGQANLSFTNSNTSANFTTSSLLVSKFLENSVNFKPDLIIGVTTQTLKDIQPINETISLTLEEIIEGLQTQNLSLIKLVRPVINALNQDSLRVWFRDPAIENLNINYPLAGNLFLGVCHPLLSSGNCFNDAAHLAENNFSSTSTNLYQDRQLQHQITLQKQSILHTFVLNYKYQPVPENTTENYQALYQVYLHPAAQFVGLEKNNQEINLVVSKETSGDLSLFQIPLSHSPQETVSIKINFIIPNSPFKGLQNFAYSLKTFHQPGTNIQNNQLIINHSPDLSVSGITSPATIGSGKIIYQSPANISLNSIFGAQFASQP